MVVVIHENKISKIPMLRLSWFPPSGSLVPHEEWFKLCTER